MHPVFSVIHGGIMYMNEETRTKKPGIPRLEGGYLLNIDLRIQRTDQFN